MKKFIMKILAVVGFCVATTAISTMDFYTMELMSDIPKYVYFMLFGGMSMMMPLFVYSIIDETKGGK